MTTTTVERKTLVFEKAQITDAGEFSGYGAIFGNVDDGNDLIEPGFFTPVLADFLREGFIAWGHDWQTPVAMPKSAREDGIGLAIGAKFHTDEVSQRYRVVTKERLDEGMTMGLSIGYEVAEQAFRPDGVRLLRKAKRLFEVSLIMVAMNREATVIQAKGAAKSAAGNVASASWVLQAVLDLIADEAGDLDPSDPDYAEDQQDVSTLSQVRDLITGYLASTAREVGTPDDLADVAEESRLASQWGYMGRTRMTLEEHADVAKATAKTFTNRLVRTNRPRLKEGRVLSSVNDSRMEEWETTLAAMLSDLRDLRASAKPKSDTEKALLIAEIEYQLLLASEYGLAV